MAVALFKFDKPTTAEYYGIYKSESLTLKNFNANFKDFWKLDPNLQELRN